MSTDVMAPLRAHAWNRSDDDWYVEPFWCSKRLFDVEKFHGLIWDPACGFGRIPDQATAAGYNAMSSDKVDRGYSNITKVGNFFDPSSSFLIADNIVSNPPFNVFYPFAREALRRCLRKVALLWLVRTLPAARWLQETPLARIWLLTPRPSMPPGHVIARGENPCGGKQDFCWLVWEHGYSGAPEIRWLHRDGDK